MLQCPKQYLIVTLILLFVGADIAWIASRQIFVNALELLYNPNKTPSQEAQANRLFYTYAVIISVYYFCINLAYWIFTMRYWSLSKKIKLLIRRKDTERIERVTQIVFRLGVLFILASAIGFGWSEWVYLSDKNIRIF